MSGALDSGMDLVVELSAPFLDRIIRNQYGGLRVCITDLTGDLFGFPVRNLVPVINQVSLRQDQNTVSLALEMLVMYGEGQVFDNTWTDLRGFTQQFLIGLSTAVENGNVRLRFNLTSLPTEILDSLGADEEGNLSIAIPLQFLSQTRDETVLLAAMVVAPALLKVVDDSTLAIGIDVELSRDPEWIARGGGLDVGDGDEEDVLGICGLPDQPAVDAEQFGQQFTRSFVPGSDWGIALDAVVIDALLRTVDMNRAGEAVEGCEQEGARRSMCLRLSGLEDGVIWVRGHGEVFACPDPAESGWNVFAPDDFYEIRFDAGLRLSVEGGVGGAWPPVLRARYELTDVQFWGADSEWNGCADPEEHMAEEDREGELPFAGVETIFGSPEDLTGELRMSHAEVFSTGMVFRGTGSVQAPQLPRIGTPDTVLFATGCEEDEARTFTRTLTISNESGGRLHVCPLVIRDLLRDDPDHEFSHADLFSIAGPAELEAGGAGLTIAARESVAVELRLTADTSERYTALLEIPNNAADRSVRLIGDLRSAAPVPESDSLRVERTDYAHPCTGGFPRARPVRRSLQVTNRGPGNLNVCSIEFPVNPENPDGAPVFAAGVGGYPRYVAAEASTAIEVVFNPGEAGVGREYDGSLRIRTNAGDLEVNVVGVLQHAMDEDAGGVLGSFDDDLFCGDADWDRIQDSGGRLLDVRQLEEFLSLLGGVDCCPPPRGPACLCVDMWEIALGGVPPGIELEVLGGDHGVIASNRARFPARMLMLPIREGRPYALQAKLPPGLAKAQRSPLIMRRWLLQQDGAYSSSQRLSDLAVAGDFCYAAGTAGLEVVSLENPWQPAQAGVVPALAGSTGVVRWGEHLLIAQGVLKVYSVADPRKPKLVSELKLPSSIRSLFTSPIPGRSASLVWALGKQLYVVELSDPRKPRRVAATGVQVESSGGMVAGHLAYLFGKQGMEVFNLSKPQAPASVALLRTKQEVRFAIVLGSFALLVYDQTTIDLVDISNLKNLQFAGAWKLEKWTEEFVPLAGRVVRHKGHFLIVRGDQLGFRLMQVRRNRVDQEGLRKRRRPHPNGV